jgi:hypothetical protein
MKVSPRAKTAALIGAGPIVLAAVALLSIRLSQRVVGRLPAEAHAILDRAEKFELLSIDPDVAHLKPYDPRARYHGWPILGSTHIDDEATRREIVHSLDLSIAKAYGPSARCFNPRHAVRAIDGSRTVDLLICFECRYLEIYVDDKQLPTEDIASGEQPYFDELLTKAKVPLPRPSH